MLSKRKKIKANKTPIIISAEQWLSCFSIDAPKFWGPEHDLGALLLKTKSSPDTFKKLARLVVSPDIFREISVRQKSSPEQARALNRCYQDENSAIRSEQEKPSHFNAPEALQLLIKTATSATFVVMIQGSSCLYAGPKYNTPP